MEKHGCKYELFANSSLVSEANWPGKQCSELAKRGDHMEKRQDQNCSRKCPREGRGLCDYARRECW